MSNDEIKRLISYLEELLTREGSLSYYEDKISSLEAELSGVKNDYAKYIKVAEETEEDLNAENKRIYAEEKRLLWLLEEQKGTHAEAVIEYMFKIDGYVEKINEFKKYDEEKSKEYDLMDKANKINREITVALEEESVDKDNAIISLKGEVEALQFALDIVKESGQERIRELEEGNPQIAINDYLVEQERRIEAEQELIIEREINGKLVRDYKEKSEVTSQEIDLASSLIHTKGELGEATSEVIRLTDHNKILLSDIRGAEKELLKAYRLVGSRESEIEVLKLELDSLNS